MAKEIKTNSEKVDKLINRVAEGDIKVPPLQRPFVWKTEQILKLLESIYHDYPVGSVLLWETNENLPATRTVAGFKIPDKRPEYPHNYILDGQQRLSTLYGVFCADRRPGVQQRGYEVDQNNFEILFDIKKDKFIHADDKGNSKYFEVKYLLDSIKFIEALGRAEYTNTDKEKLKKLHSIFSNYEIPVVTTKKRSKEEVGIIFERINNTGTTLGLFDLMVAWTWTEDFHLRQKFDEVFESLEKKSFSNIEHKVILQCLSAILKESSASRVILSLEPKKIRDNMGLLLKSLEKTIDYFSTELCVNSVELLPHTHQIVPLCFFFSKVNTPSNEQKGAIDKWFWKTSFSDRYSSSTDSHIDEDIESFKKVVEGDFETSFSKVNYTISPEQMRETRFYRTNAFSRAFVVLLAGRSPRNLVNGGKVDVGSALSSFNRKEYHHIFPKAFLEKKGFERNKINSLCNFCILPSDSNKKISDSSPSKYFPRIPRKSLKNILASNILPTKMGIYKSDDYTQFLEERSRKIVEYLDSLLV